MFNACRGMCSIFDIFKNPQQRQDIQFSESYMDSQTLIKQNKNNNLLSEKDLFKLQMIDKEGVLPRLQQFLQQNQSLVNSQKVFKDEFQGKHNPYYDYLSLILKMYNFSKQNSYVSENLNLQKYQQALKHNITFIKTLAQFLHRKFFRISKLNRKCKEFRILQLQKLIQNTIDSVLYLSLHLNQIQNSLLQYQFLTNFKEFLSLMSYYLQAQKHTFKNIQSIKPKYNQNLHDILVRVKGICQDILVDENCKNLLLDWKQCLKRIISIYKECKTINFDMCLIEQEISNLEQSYQLSQSNEQKGVFFEISTPLKRTSSYVKEIKHHNLTRSSSIDSRASEENQAQNFYKENEARLQKLNLQQMGDLAFQSTNQKFIKLSFYLN